MVEGGIQGEVASAALAYFSDLQEPSLLSRQVAYLSNLGIAHDLRMVIDTTYLSYLGIVHDLCKVIDTALAAKNKMLPHGVGVIWTQNIKFAETE